MKMGTQILLGIGGAAAVAGLGYLAVRKLGKPISDVAKAGGGIIEKGLSTYGQLGTQAISTIGNTAKSLSEQQTIRQKQRQAFLMQIASGAKHTAEQAMHTGLNFLQSINPFK